MVNFKNGRLSKKEERIISNILAECSDIYGDCYITRSNLRLFLRENQDVLFDIIKKGDKVTYEENEGLIIVVGYSDKFPRKYIKILTKDESATNRLLKTLHWNIKEDLYCKIKKTNPVKRTLERNGFRWKGDRGKECLLCRTYIPSRPIRQKVEDE